MTIEERRRIKKIGHLIMSNAWVHQLLKGKLKETWYRKTKAVLYEENNVRCRKRII